jgi:hypothetical protein
MRHLTYTIFVLSGLLLSVAASAETKPIPKAFHGTWVGHVDKKLTAKQVASVCRRSHGEWGTWLITINSKTIDFSYPAGGGGRATVSSYSKYLASNIQGVLKVKKDVEGDTYTEEEKAGFAVTGNKLKYTYGDFVTNLTKCQ